MSMIDEMVQQIAQRTGLPPAQAQQAAHAAIEFLDGRLPAPIGGNLKRMVEGGGAAGGAGGLGDVAGKLGGLFGG
ncbi:MAG TPA: hypothetical protein VF665_14385 [Longimicrobium sp.]|jgi:hypothetical protein|uniref:hypothetical protein n=1 Tax=Longimicrobium sp. TaxID=2029185 RepID=UPI002EDB9EFA